MRGKARCKMHGGLSTGPKTDAGRARVREGYRRSLIEDLEQREMDRAAGRYAPYYRGSDAILRMRYGSPSDRRRLAERAEAAALVAEHHEYDVRKPEPQRTPLSEPPDTLPFAPTNLPDWDPFEV